MFIFYPKTAVQSIKFCKTTYKPAPFWPGADRKTVIYDIFIYKEMNQSVSIYTYSRLIPSAFFQNAKTV